MRTLVRGQLEILRATGDSMRRTAAFALALTLCCAIVGCSTSSTATVAETPDQGPTLDQVAAIARVFNSTKQISWADGSEHLVKEDIAFILKSFPHDKIYVSVGLATDYPDQALVTVVRPSMNQGMQYLFDPANPAPGLGRRDVDIQNIPAGTKNWNATVDAQGNILVKGREAESMP